MAKFQRNTLSPVKKLVLSAVFLALGLVLPFFTGQLEQIGNLLLPMHLPVFLCGLICSWQYGAAVGLVLPLLRNLLFTMPRLYPNAIAMAVELCVYGLVCGLIYQTARRQSTRMVYLALLSAMAAGRIAWGLMEMLLLGFTDTPFTWEAFLAGAFVTAWPGIVLQLVLIPSILSALHHARLLPYRVKPRVCKDTAAFLRAKEEIEKLLSQKERVIVAIDGRCGAGKSTLAASLQTCFSCGLVPMDHFFLPKEKRTAERLDTPGENVEHERFAEEVLTPLLAGKPVRYRPFDCSRQALADPIRVKKSRLTLVEGSYSLHPQLWDAYDLRIFVTAEEETRLRRLLSREGETGLAAFRETWIPLEERYFAAFGLQNRADLMLDTTER